MNEIKEIIEEYGCKPEDFKDFNINIVVEKVVEIARRTSALESLQSIAHSLESIARKGINTKEAK